MEIRTYLCFAAVRHYRDWFDSHDARYAVTIFTEVMSVDLRRCCHSTLFLRLYIR